MTTEEIIGLVSIFVFVFMIFAVAFDLDLKSPNPYKESFKLCENNNMTYKILKDGITECIDQNHDIKYFKTTGVKE